MRARTTKRRKLILPLLGSIVALTIVVNAFLEWHYTTSVRHAREAVLRQDLHDLRRLISEYTLDNHRPPASLQELVAARYLASIPKDPFSGRDDTWVVEISSNPKLPGVVDVHSGSHDISSNGDRYSAW